MSLSQVEYYKANQFNSVHISLEDPAVREAHFSRRSNLYESHLQIPKLFWEDASVLEFGCNSGENAVVLAAFGAKLTLVEPNEQVLPRLVELFRRFALEKRIARLEQSGMDEFRSDESYDVVIAEGFLYSLANREEMLAKITRLLRAGGLGIISFNDRCGCLMEMVKRMVLWRAYEWAGIEDRHSPAALELARRLFYPEFARSGASRPFETWWKDVLVSPVVTRESLWSYQELLALLLKSECAFYSSSPKWNTADHYRWYKRLSTPEEEFQRTIQSWKKSFSYLITGISEHNQEEPSDAAVQATSELVDQMAAYSTDGSVSSEALEYPPALKDYLSKCGPAFRRVNSELEQLFSIVHSGTLEELVPCYHQTTLQKLWGTPYHYLSFSKNAGPGA